MSKEIVILNNTSKSDYLKILVYVNQKQSQFSLFWPFGYFTVIYKRFVLVRK